MKGYQSPRPKTENEQVFSSFTVAMIAHEVNPLYVPFSGAIANPKFNTNQTNETTKHPHLLLGNADKCIIFQKFLRSCSTPVPLYRSLGPSVGRCVWVFGRLGCVVRLSRLKDSEKPTNQPTNQPTNPTQPNPTQPNPTQPKPTNHKEQQRTTFELFDHLRTSVGICLAWEGSPLRSRSLS